MPLAPFFPSGSSELVIAKRNGLRLLFVSSSLPQQEHPAFGAPAAHRQRQRLTVGCRLVEDANAVLDVAVGYGKGPSLGEIIHHVYLDLFVPRNRWSRKGLQQVAAVLIIP